MRTPAIRLDFWLQIWPQPASLLTSARASSPESLKVKIFVEFNYLKKCWIQISRRAKIVRRRRQFSSSGEKRKQLLLKGEGGRLLIRLVWCKVLLFYKEESQRLKSDTEWKLTTILLRQDRRKTEALEQTLLELTGEVDNYKWVQQLYMLYNNRW